MEIKKDIKDLATSKDLKDLAIDVIDKFIDSKLTDEVLKEVPIVKYLIGLKNIYSSINDKIFIKKSLKVLLELKDVKIQYRTELLVDLADEHSDGTEKILMAINHLESYEKCTVFGRICKLKANSHINVDEFKRLTKLTQDAYLDDLLLLEEFKRRGDSQIHEGDYAPIITLGLIYQEPSEQESIKQVEYHDPMLDETEIGFEGGEIKFNYHLSTLGELLFNHFYELFPQIEKPKAPKSLF
jgi:hypothetical protein